jgi:hypothetical protein
MNPELQRKIAATNYLHYKYCALLGCYAASGGNCLLIPEILYYSNFDRRVEPKRRYTLCNTPQERRFYFYCAAKCHYVNNNMFYAFLYQFSLYLLNSLFKSNIGNPQRYIGKKSQPHVVLSVSTPTEAKCVILTPLTYLLTYSMEQSPS